MTILQLDIYLEGLGPKQKKAFKRLVKRLGKQRSLSDYYVCALAFMEMQPSDTGYRSDWMGQLCRALAAKDVKISPSLGYRLLKFAALYPGPYGKSRVKELDGKIPWDSMMRILHVEDKETQSDLLVRASTEQLSTRDVRRLITEMTTYRRSRGGRPPSEPEKHPNRALRNLLAFTSKWQVMKDAWLDKHDKLQKSATKLKAQQLTENLLEDLASVIVRVEEMSKSAKLLSTQLASLLMEFQAKKAK